MDNELRNLLSTIHALTPARLEQLKNSLDLDKVKAEIEKKRAFKHEVMQVARKYGFKTRDEAAKVFADTSIPARVYKPMPVKVMYNNIPWCATGHMPKPMKIAMEEEGLSREEFIEKYSYVDPDISEEGQNSAEVA